MLPLDHPGGFFEVLGAYDAAPRDSDLGGGLAEDIGGFAVFLRVSRFSSRLEFGDYFVRAITTLAFTVRGISARDGYRGRFQRRGSVVAGGLRGMFCNLAGFVAGDL